MLHRTLVASTALALSAFWLSFPEAASAQKPARKDGKMVLGCGFDRTVATVYQEDNKTVREVRTSFRDREETVVYRDDGKTVHYKVNYDRATVKREIDYFGPDGKLRTKRVYRLDILGDIGTTGVKVTELMSVTYFDKDGEEEYKQHWTYTKRDGKLTWVLDQVRQTLLSGVQEKRTLLVPGEENGKEFITILVTGPRINGISEQIYEVKDLPAQYRDWMRERYADDDPTPTKADDCFQH